MIEAVTLTKRYASGSTAVHRLSLRVEPGEIYCLLGANGAGKTTTIKILLGFVAPSEGRALVGGVDVALHPLRARRAVSYVSESSASYPYLTARETLHFFAALDGRARLDEATAAEAMEIVGLQPHVLDRPTRELSKGMRQKLALAVALLKDASVLLLDEPTSGLDPAAAREIHGVLGRFRDRGKAVLMSTHDLFRAKDVADRVGILRRGEKVFEGSREELDGRDLEEVYLRSMADPGALGPACPHAELGRLGEVAE